MAFLFVVENGTGRPNATSYVSVEDADTYFEPQAVAEDWRALDDTQKEYYLAWATRVLDTRTIWSGQKAVPTGKLRWPRKYVYDREDVLVSSTVVPPEVKDATCEMARFLIEYDPTRGQGVENIKRVMVDVVEVEYQDGTAQQEWPSYISEMLAPLGVFRSGGAGFAKIVRM